MGFEYFVLGVVAYQILKMLALAINRTVVEHRQKKFIKLVNVMFPDRQTITFIAVDSSDKRAMTKLERQLREQYDVPGQAEDLFGDRGFSGGLRDTAPRHRDDPPR